MFSLLTGAFANDLIKRVSMFPQALPLLPALILLSASLRSASADPDVVASSVETESICIAFLCFLSLVFDVMIDVKW